ncbi:hypothetical protein ACFY1J_31150 [Streptomyces sp. NPDC001406]|uniref:hypothetical protein n=1 Tax=Streptomyces sp. NPDC001406 TaxID=3364572 RepID=UPI00369EFB08
MTATHIAAPHHPLAALTTWLTEHFHHRRPAEAGTPDGCEVLRLAFPPGHPYRQDLEAPALKGAFAQLAADHPTEVAVAAMRDADREELLLGIVDDWFRHAHAAPQHRWSPQEITLYEQLLGSVRACFRPAGGAR